MGAGQIVGASVVADTTAELSFADLIQLDSSSELSKVIAVLEGAHIPTPRLCLLFFSQYR